MLYLSSVMDCFNGEIISYTIGDTQDVSFVLDTLNQLPTIYYVNKGELSKMNVKEGYIEKKDLEVWLKEINIIR